MKKTLINLLKIALDKQLTREEMRIASHGHYRNGNEIIWRTGNRFISRRQISDNRTWYVETRFYDNTGLLMYTDKFDSLA